MSIKTLFSQLGFDVKTCADRFLVFSSDFQLLKIYDAYSVSTTIPVSGFNEIEINHNLGYFAPYFVIYNGSTTIGQNNSYFMCDSNGDRLWDGNELNRYALEVWDDFDLGASNPGDTVYFTIYILEDDFRTVTEQNINSGIVSGSGNNQFGFSISKEGFDVKTCDKKDMILTSNDFSQLVHKKGIDTSGDITVTVPHTLGYPPAAFAYTKGSADDWIEWARNGVQVSSSNIQLVTGGGTDVYYIITKNKLT